VRVVEPVVIVATLPVVSRVTEAATPPSVKDWMRPELSRTMDARVGFDCPKVALSAHFEAS
jgi:hypothetical protein